jgi:hypothetical protein
MAVLDEAREVVWATNSAIVDTAGCYQMRPPDEAGGNGTRATVPLALQTAVANTAGCLPRYEVGSRTCSPG